MVDVFELPRVILASEHIDERGKKFAKKMQEKVDKYGDTAFFSYRQVKFLWALYHIAANAEKPSEQAGEQADEQVAEGAKPKSRLQELKEKKAKLLRSIKKRAKLEGEANNLSAKGDAWIAGELHTEITAKSKQERTHNRQRVLRKGNARVSYDKLI